MLSPNILPLTLQSRSLSFSEWISLVTLALAPLVAHVLTGAPRSSYLVKTRPRWHDRLVHYNPTSIIWRYSAITDRRIRALDWNSQDLAATNTLFWTAHGWDGTEDMIQVSMPYCLRLPECSHAKVLSADTAKTIVLALQGAQALYVLIGTFFGNHEFSANLALDTTFLPFALLGIWRLSAAIWLTDDYMFTFRHSSMNYPLGLEPMKNSFDSLLERSPVSIQLLDRFKPISPWPSRVCRTAYTVALLGVWTIVVLLGTPVCWPGYPCKDGFNHAASTVIQIIFFFVVMTMSVVLCIYYFAQGPIASTVIPCISATWYKIYSVAIAILAVALLVLSAIETRQTPCGKYSKLPGHIGDVASCSWDQWYIPFSAHREDTALFGTAFNRPLDELLAKGDW
ncbi:hypothetical protein F5Y19DRAFT_408919 [Xylariaceae sp. FL1651]|nr:hypothetical protein F5Y19DRAFT_408919 [Xylariaceae sp. FL1651]